MPRNRRNTRRIKSIKDVLNMKTFLTIVFILLTIIIVCIGINEYKRYEDRQLLADQKAELEKQSQEIFSQISSSISGYIRIRQYNKDVCRRGYFM